MDVRVNQMNCVSYKFINDPIVKKNAWFWMIKYNPPFLLKFHIFLWSGNSRAEKIIIIVLANQKQQGRSLFFYCFMLLYKELKIVLAVKLDIKYFIEWIWRNGRHFEK